MSKATYMTQKDALELVIDSAESKITRDIIVNTEIGGYKPGDKIDMGEDLTNVIEKLVTVYQTPVLSISLTPSTTLYEKGVDSVTGLKVLAQVTKKTNPISSIQWYINNSLVDELTSADGISDGGNYTYTHNATISNDVTIKVVVTDSENKTVTKEMSIKFVGMSYYGILPKSTVSPTVDEITNMNTILKDTKKFVYSGITTSLGKVCIAYPSIFGELTSIKDLVHNIDYSGDTFVKSTITINNLEYYCYIQKNAVGVTNGELTFA